MYVPPPPNTHTFSVAKTPSFCRNKALLAHQPLFLSPASQEVMTIPCMKHVDLT